MLDIDLCGPSVPKLFGVDEAEIRQTEDGWLPVPARQEDKVKQCYKDNKVTTIRKSESFFITEARIEGALRESLLFSPSVRGDDGRALHQR